MAFSVLAGHNCHGSCSERFNELIDNPVILVLIEDVVATMRSFFSVLVFALLLCTIFPVAQIGRSVDIGVEQAGDFSDTGAATDSEDDSPQETPDDCVASRMSVSDCESSRSHASMDEIPPSTLLISRLIHPPTARS
jgi:hypothetical protein